MISIKIPQEHEQALRRAWGESLDTAVLEALIIESYRSRKFGAATVRQMLGHASRWDTEQWLSSRGVNLNYSIEDLEADRRTFDKLFAKLN